MFEYAGGIEEAIEAFLKAGDCKLVKKLPQKGNKDAFIIVQNKKCNWLMFSIMSGITIDGLTNTVFMFEKIVNTQGRLF